MKFEKMMEKTEIQEPGKLVLEPGLELRIFQPGILGPEPGTLFPEEMRKPRYIVTRKEQQEAGEAKEYELPKPGILELEPGLELRIFQPGILGPEPGTLFPEEMRKPRYFVKHEQ